MAFFRVLELVKKLIVWGYLLLDNGSYDFLRSGVMNARRVFRVEFVVGYEGVMWV